MIELLQYDFFRYALIAGVLVSLIAGTLGSLVVLRREPNITHSIANILFVGIVVSFFFSGNYYVFAFISAILGVILISLLEKYSPISRESSKEILGQLGLAGGIFGVGMLGNIQIDIFNFLFGNILFVTLIDLSLLAALGVVGFGLWMVLGKKLVRVALSPEISKSQGIRVQMIEFTYLLYLALFIAFSLKIFGVLLLGAFLVIPGNIAKNISHSFHGVFAYATIISIICVFIGLYLSYYFDTSAGATIVLILGFLFLISLFFQKH